MRERKERSARTRALRSLATAPSCPKAAKAAPATRMLELASKTQYNRAIVKKRLGVAASLYTILQILSLTLFEKTPLDQLLNDAALQNLNSVDSNQLNFFS